MKIIVCIKQVPGISEVRIDPKTNTLSGVVVVEFKRRGIEKIICAEAAKIHFDPHERFNEVRIIAYNTY
ncbi:hypothetical protein LCGC14_2964690, partial [marine sediment metagenome]